jgi:hypothetical protein
MGVPNGIAEKGVTGSFPAGVVLLSVPSLFSPRVAIYFRNDVDGV